MKSDLRRWVGWFRVLLALGALSVSAHAADDVMIIRLEEPSATPADSPPSLGGAPEPKAVEQPRTEGHPVCVDRSANPPSIAAISAVVMDADTGQVIYSKNPHLRRPNASTTKIMTAILLIERRGMSQMIKASKNACQTPFTSLNLRPGEQISAKDLLMGMMVRSANDAAVAVAENIGGTVPKFAALMNSKAGEIGCRNTHFVTPNGLPARDHYSSAYDLCLIARYALRYAVFNEVVTTRKHLLNSRTINRKDLAVFAKARFLKDYPGADGIKSGYVKEAGYCYVGSATRDGWRLVSAVLKSDDSSRDTAVVMDYAFAKYKPVVVARAGTACTRAEIECGSPASVPAAPVRDFHVVVPRSGASVTTKCEFKPLRAPIPAGTAVGVLIAMVDGREAGRIDLESTEPVKVGIAHKAWGWTKWGGIGIVCLVMVRRYGNALTKSARRRRRRVTAPVRGFNRFG